MGKLRTPLLVASELALLVLVILFWGSIISVILAVCMIFPLVAILSGKAVRDGRNGEVDDLDPVKLTFRKHMEMSGIETEKEE